MNILRLIVNNIRNHEHTEIELCEGINIFHGLNGVGKTSILEAVSICSFSKSFLPVADVSLIRKGENFYRTSAEARYELDVPYKISVKYSPGARKQISSTLGENLLPKDIIGQMPMVILSPDFKSITFGSPEDRRQFIDRLLSQVSKVYFELLLNYKKALKQRNSLLTKAKTERMFDYSLIEPWSDVLIKTGAEIVIRRKKFVNDFIDEFNKTYGFVSEGREEVRLEYIPSGLSEKISEQIFSIDDVIENFKLFLKNNRKNEIQRGTTLFGPQKDELKILIDKGVAKEYASQGQHKSLLISLKFAEFNYLKSLKRETPIILLDDIFSELDIRRTQKALELIFKNSAQTLITVTEASELKKIIENRGKTEFFKVVDGFVERN